MREHMPFSDFNIYCKSYTEFIKILNMFTLIKINFMIYYK